MEKAIIGGTGIYDIGGGSYTKVVETIYGKTEVNIVNIEGEEIIFLARHGRDHSVPPHLINYRANIMALKELGVKYIYATAAVGSCNENYAPGDIVVIKDFIDFTKLRPVTFLKVVMIQLSMWIWGILIVKILGKNFMKLQSLNQYI